MTTDTRFVVSECPRCAALTLTGMVGGLKLRVDTRTIPAADARVLVRYGVTVLVADLGHTGITCDFYDPTTHRLDRRDRHLVTAHTCRRRRTMPQTTSRPTAGRTS